MIELFNVFFKLGCLGFGGPVAAMGLIEEEVVRKRKWLTVSQFTQVYTVLKLFPGPFSTQMAIYVGNLRGGLLGAIVTFIAFISPSVLSVLILSYFYVKQGAIHASGQTFFGFQLAALVIIFQSAILLAKPYWRDRFSWLIAVLAGVIVYLFPRFEPLILVAFGAVGIFAASALGLMYVATSEHAPAPFPKSPHLAWLSLAYVPAFACAVSVGVLADLYWTSFKAGAFVFGSGLAILPLLEGEVVSHFHWLTHNQFMDGLAMGQITPGPIVTAATFIGYVVHSWIGALVATLGIFLPAFFNVILVLPRVCQRMAKSPRSGSFLKFAIPAVIGAILSSSIRIGNGAFGMGFGPEINWVLLVVGLVISMRFKIPGWLLILVVGIVGVVVASTQSAHADDRCFVAQDVHRRGASLFGLDIMSDIISKTEKNMRLQLM
jgi:chromate transporter